MRIFITGATGFIGSQLAARLSKDSDHAVGLLARQSSRTLLPELARCQPYYGSLTDAELLRRALRDFQPDVICHLGAITPVAYSFDHPQEVTETNYLGTVNLAEAARRECPSLRRFIFASSMEVYGAPSRRDATYSGQEYFQTFNPNIKCAKTRRPFGETDVVFPMCPYAVAKQAAESFLRYLWRAYRFPAVALRQTNCYGRDRDDYFVVEAIITQMLRGSIVELGDSRPVRNFLFIEDLLRLYEVLIASEDAALNGEIFNTGPANALTIGELADRCAVAADWKGEIRWSVRPQRAGEVFYLNSSNEKVTAAVGWSPRVELDDGLRRTVELWREKVVPLKQDLSTII